MLNDKKAGDVMTAGTHGTTYGGNPLAMAVANAVFDEITSNNFLDNVAKMGELLKSKLNEIHQQFPHIIEEIRGIGLMLGIKINDKYSNNDIVQKFIDNKLLTIPAGENVVRLLPPLIINENHIKEACDKIIMSFTEISNS